MADPDAPKPEPKSTAVATRPERQVQRVENLQPMLDTDRFEHFQRASSALMHSSILPESVRGNSPQQCFSNLMLIFDIADRWKVPALSIAQGIAIVHNKVVYEGKLIAAMLTASMGLRLHYHYTGERGTIGYRIYVADRDFDLLSEEQLAALAPGKYPKGWRMIDGSVADWQTFNKDGRTPNPAWTGQSQHNQLSYRGAREWARLYEPAQMLGVYGDDEIDAMTMRMENARDLGQATTVTGLTAGFTAPAAESTTEAAQEAQLAQDVAEIVEGGQEKAAEKPKAAAKPKGKAPTGEAKALGRTDEDHARIQAETAERLRVCQELEAEAHAAAAKGDIAKNPLQAIIDKCTTDEQRRYVENGWQAGVSDWEQAQAMKDGADDEGEAECEKCVEAMARAKEQGHRTHNKAGEPMFACYEHAAVTSDTEDDGADDGAAAEVSNETLDAIAEAEPEIVETVLEDHAGDDSIDDGPSDDVAAWHAKLPELSDWQAIKLSMNALAKTDAWKQAGVHAIAAVRAAAWTRMGEIIAAGGDRLDFIADLTAFRCWIETTDDTDAIQGNWQALVRQPVYQALSDEQKRKLEAATLARVEAIHAARKPA